MAIFILSMVSILAVEAAPGYQQVRNGFRVPTPVQQMRQAKPNFVPIPQSRNSMDSAQWQPVSNSFPESSRYIGARAEADAAASGAEDKKEEPAAAAGADEGYVNVYGEKLETCLPATMYKDPDYCTYRSKSDAVHEICVTENRPSRNRQGWQAYYDKSLQCIRIEDYDPFSADLAPFDFTNSGGQRWGGVKLSDYYPKCDALPAGVLDSEWSMGMVSGGNFATRKYTYTSEVSSKYEGDAPAKQSGVKMVDSPGAKKVRDGIAKICEVCRTQTTSETALASLGAKCDAILKLVPDKKFEPFAIAEKKRPYEALEAEEHTYFLGTPAFVLIGLLMGSGITIAMHRLRRSTPTATTERLLA